jgi:hypothetical protein
MPKPHNGATAVATTSRQAADGREKSIFFAHYTKTAAAGKPPRRTPDDFEEFVVLLEAGGVFDIEHRLRLQTGDEALTGSE